MCGWAGERKSIGSRSPKVIGILLVLHKTAPPRDSSLEPFKAQLVGYIVLINGWYPEVGLHIPIGAEVASGYMAGLCLTGLASCRGPVGQIRKSSAKASFRLSALRLPLLRVGLGLCHVLHWPTSLGWENKSKDQSRTTPASSAWRAEIIQRKLSESALRSYLAKSKRPVDQRSGFPIGQAQT